MNVEHIEVLVEEPSMEAALRLLLPKIEFPGTAKRLTGDGYGMSGHDKLISGELRITDAERLIAR